MKGKNNTNQRNETKKGKNLKNPKVDIIITAYNNKDIIKECLDSVKKQTFKSYKCIVVDDKSTDGTPEYIEKNFKWVKVIRRTHKTGPSQNRNIGIAEGKAELIATLDSDVVLDKKWLELQYNFLKENPNTGIAASKLLYKKRPGIINAAGGRIRFPGIGNDIGSGKNDSKEFDSIKDVDYACSAAMLMRREMFEKIGGFDKTYFYGHEDTDLGWRARIAGYGVKYNPKAIALHDVNLTVSKMSDKVVFHGTKNRIRSMIKNYPALKAIAALAVYFGVTIVQIFIKPNRLARIKGWFWNVANIGSTLKERKQIKNLAKKSIA